MPSDPSLVSLVDRDAALEWYRRNRTRSLQLFDMPAAHSCWRESLQAVLALRVRVPICGSQAQAALDPCAGGTHLEIE